MALNKFYFKVDNLHLLPNEFVKTDPVMYGNSSNVIVAVDATAYGEKASDELQQVVEVSEKFNHLHIIWNQQSSPNNFIEYENLKEEDVISMIHENLQYRKLTIDIIKQNLEDKANTYIAQNKKNIPW